MKAEELKRAASIVFPPSEKLNEILVKKGTSPLNTGIRLSELLKRPQITYDDIKEIDITRPDLPRAVFEAVEIEFKYSGYIKRQKADISEMRRIENKLLPEDIDYSEIKGLRLEAREKLNKVRPVNIGQASRISGVSPADISVLLIWLSAK